MKKVTIITFILICILTSISAQNNEHIENLINTDLEQNTYPKEPDAPAFVAFDKAETEFYRTESGFYYVMTRKVRIKILSELGIKYAEVEIPTYNSNNVTEKVIDIRAVSYNNKNGKTTKVELNTINIHKEKKENNWDLTKFAIPDVQVGSVIEYEYKLESNYLFNIQDWNFQWEIPVVYSQYIIHMIPFYNYQYYLQGATKFDVYSAKESSSSDRYFGIDYKKLIYTFGMKDVPSFKNEGFITSKSDYILKIDFQLAQIIHPDGQKVDVITTWPQLKKDLLTDSNFGLYMRTAQKQADKVINTKAMSTLEPNLRIDSIINFIKNNYKWDESYRLKANNKLSKVLETKRGSSAEINLLAIGVLNAAGIKAYPVIISTRRHGKIRTNYPFYENFNSTLICCEIGTNLSIKDATNTLVNNNSIPIECANEIGLLLKDDKNTEWLSIKTTGNSRIKTMLKSRVDENKLVSQITVKATEYDGLNLRENYGTDKQKVLKHLSNENDEVIDSTITIKNMENAKNPYEIQYTATNKLSKSEKDIYIQPFLREVINENPFKLSNRTYPIDMMYPQCRDYISYIEIPKNYSVKYLPANKFVKNTFFELNYNSQTIDGELVISFSYKLHKQVYSADDYTLLKSFFKDIITIANDKIVIQGDK